MIDESADRATAHNLVMYTRYVLDGKVHNRFLCLVGLPGGTASEIVDTVLKVFAARSMSLEKLCGIATDGASAMVECRREVTTQLKQNNPYLLSVHCIAHRLALATRQATNSVPYVKQYQLYVNNIYRYFRYSTTHAHKLKEIQSVLQLAERKFHQIFHTRWLSFEGSISAIIASLDPLYTVLIEESSLDPTAKGIISTFSFLATTYLLADILPVLARLSKRFQRSLVDFTTVSDRVSITISTLATFKSTPGPNLAAFFQVSSTLSSSRSFYYMGHHMSDDRNRDNLIDKLIDNLNSRFPDGEIISMFSIFDPQYQEYIRGREREYRTR